MKRVIVAGIGLCSVLWTVSGLAYEPWTHAQLSDVALGETVLVTPPPGGTTTILQDLGLPAYNDTDQTQFYTDIQSSEDVLLGPAHGDAPSGLASQYIVMKSDGPHYTPYDPTANVEDLIKAGAMLEDAGDRALNHFYNPLNQEGLSVGFGPLSKDIGMSALSWAQNSTCSTYSPSGPYEPTDNNYSYPPQDQCYSLQDAKSYYYYALTAKDPQVRKNQFGDLFLSLGHLMHLVEDMAQPQHVRNEAHCDDKDKCDTEFVHYFYHPSQYEAFVYDQTKDVLNLSAFANYPNQSRPIVDPVQSVSGWNAMSYLSQQGSAYGLADITNSNFVSARTNFGTAFFSGAAEADSDFPLPTPNYGAYTESIDDVYRDLGQESAPSDLDAYCATLAAKQPSISCNVEFYVSAINDPELDLSSGCTPVTGFNPQKQPDNLCYNEHASSYSIFQSDLASTNTNWLSQIKPTFSLNNDNYQSQMNYLLPRAIGYAAGFVNYFFRGKLDVQWDENQPGDPSSQTNLLVTNLSSDALSNNGGPGGDLGVYYDATDGNRYRANPQPTPVNLAAYCAQVVNGQINPNCSFLPPDSMMVSVPLPLSHPAAKPNEYILVYTGPMGDDNAIIKYNFKPDDPEFELMAWNFTDNNGTVDAAARYDAQGNLLFHAYTSAWSQNGASHGCSLVDLHTKIYCSQLVDLKLFRHDANSYDREYTLRDEWGIHALESVETVVPPPGQSSLGVTNDYDFLKYSRDVDSQGNLLPYAHPEYQDCFKRLGLLAVNRTKVFVMVERYNDTLSSTSDNQTSTPCPYLQNVGAQPGSGDSVYLDIFDHSGVLQGMAMLPEFYGDATNLASGSSGYRSFAANDQMLCIVGGHVDSNEFITGFAELRSLDGSGTGISIDNANAMACTATADRFYVLDGNPQIPDTSSTVATLNSYDFNGNLKGSTVLQQILTDHQRPYKIAASSNMVYVMTDGASTKIYRYERTVGPNGMDTFTLAPVPTPTTMNPNPTPNPLIATGTQQSGSQAIAVDMYQALSLAGPQ